MEPSMHDPKVAALAQLVRDAKRIAFLGGAGLSTESGIPDFRSEDGIFRAKQSYGAPPETLLSRPFFDMRPAVFFDYYRKFLLYPDAAPNAAHRALAALEREREGRGRLTAVITQNIDGLHTAAGSHTVLELHGSVLRNRCMRCNAFYSLEALHGKMDAAADGVPRCGCGGIIKPEVVLYGENLDADVLSASVAHVSRADLLIIGGTSLAVYPAAALSDYFRGSDIAVINLSETQRETGASLTIRRPIGQVLTELMEALGEPIEDVPATMKPTGETAR